MIYLVGYAPLYAWYVPVAASNRLVLRLFLPFMHASASVLRDRGEGDLGGRSGLLHSWLFAAIHAALIAGVLLELHEILTYRIETVYGGG